MIIVWAVVFLGALAVIFGLVLAIASKVFEVKVDERLPLIQECLPFSSRITASTLYTGMTNAASTLATATSLG